MGIANVNAPFGLRPVRYASGAPYNGAVNLYFATGATGAIFVGAPVIQTGLANTAEFMGYAPGTLPTVSPATAGDGNMIGGVCVAVLATDRDSTPYRVNSTDRIIAVADDPNLVFHGRTDDQGTDWAGADIGKYANLVGSGGSTVFGMSSMYLDTTDGPDAADVSNQLHIVKLASIQGNDIGDFSIWEVMITNHQLAAPDRLAGIAD